MSPATILPHHDTPAPRARRVRLLVADDSLIARQAVVAYLHALPGIEIRAVCENGRSAVEAALRDEPDVVLLDLQMPGMSGLEAAEIFRNSMPHVGVILTSTHDHAEVRATCLAAGADAFVGKAALPAEFPATLAAVLEARRSPVRHRRAPGFPSRPSLDLFAQRGQRFPAAGPMPGTRPSFSTATARA